jgi:hypothetical protein
MTRSLSECHVDKAGLSREWCPEGARTTDDDLHVLLETKQLSVVVFEVVVCPPQKKISK